MRYARNYTYITTNSTKYGNVFARPCGPFCRLLPLKRNPFLRDLSPCPGERAEAPSPRRGGLLRDPPFPERAGLLTAPLSLERAHLRYAPLRDGGRELHPPSLFPRYPYPQCQYPQYLTAVFRGQPGSHSESHYKANLLRPYACAHSLPHIFICRFQEACSEYSIQ